MTQATTMVPHELRQPPAHFTNRTVQLALLDSILEGTHDRPVVQVISGLGGIGKSALASHWVHGIRGRFPHGQLYADLGAFNAAGPSDVGALLGRFLTTLGVDPRRQPADLDGLKALYRSLTAERPLLVVLDDAASAAQAEPLIPTSPGSVVLVTSRFRLGALRASHDAHLLELGKFEPDHGIQLITAIVRDERTAVMGPSLDYIVDFCDGLPIALHVLGVRMANRPDLSPKTLQGQLERSQLAVLAEKRENISVTTTFDLSYESLPPEAAELYRALGQHPGPEFGIGAATGATGKSLDETYELLDEIVQAGLLECDSGRYSFHDLVRLHAEDKAKASKDSAAAAGAARIRIIEWYLRVARHAEDLLTVADQDRLPYEFSDRRFDEDTLPGNDREQALNWLEAERPNLVDAVEAAQIDEPQLAWQLAAAMWPLFLLRKHHRDFLKVSEIGFECAREWGDRSAQALMLNRWAAACRGTGRFEEAVAKYTEAQQTLGEGGDPAIGIRSVEGLGLVALAQGRVADALTHFEEDLRLSRELDRGHDVNLALINLGVTQLKADRPAEAAQNLEQARTLLDAQGDHYNAARAQIDLGRALAHDQRFDEARAQLDAALTTMKANGSEFEQARAIHALGDVARLAGEIEEARRRYELALASYRELNRPEANPLANELDSLA